MEVRKIINTELSKMEKIKRFVEQYEFLENGKINLDYLSDKIESYSLDQTPSNPILKQFKDGGSRRQITFDFTIQAPFSALENIRNSRFCEDFSNWIERQNALNNLPDIEGAEWIRCISPGYILRINQNTAVYIIQMQFIYCKESL